MPTVREAYGLSAPNQHTIDRGLANNSGITVNSKELIGIEVEVENVQGIGLIRNMWQTKNDGSLRNNGIEFVSKPIAACDAPASLESLMKETLNEHSCFSPRTSVHIHLNFCNDPIETVTDVILVYSLFERLFYKFVGRGRIRNIYCVPLTETDIHKNMGHRGFRVDYWSKYSGLNARPIGEFGTLEFRHMHGTMDVRKLSIWIDLITRLKDYCVRTGTKDIRSMISTMDDSFNFIKLLNDIFGPMAEYLKYSSLDDVKYTYRATKLALCSSGVTMQLYQGTTKTSPFYALRNL